MLSTRDYVKAFQDELDKKGYSHTLSTNKDPNDPAKKIYALDVKKAGCTYTITCCFFDGSALLVLADGLIPIPPKSEIEKRKKLARAMRSANDIVVGVTFKGSNGYIVAQSWGNVRQSKREDHRTKMAREGIELVNRMANALDFGCQQMERALR